MLRADHLRTRRPNRKLDYLYRGPLRVKKVLSPLVVELDLPTVSRIHPVFHVNKLKLYDDDAFDAQLAENPGAVLPDGVTREDVEDFVEDREWEVEAILDSRIRRRKLEYLVCWKGYDIEDSSWEPAAHVTNAADLVKAFHDSYPGKPGEGTLGLADARCS